MKNSPGEKIAVAENIARKQDVWMQSDEKDVCSLVLSWLMISVQERFSKFFISYILEIREFHSKGC